jgi:hypothetical protein
VGRILKGENRTLLNLEPGSLLVHLMMAAGSKSENRSQRILTFLLAPQRQLSRAEEENRRGPEPSFVTLSRTREGELEPRATAC